MDRALIMDVSEMVCGTLSECEDGHTERCTELQEKTVKYVEWKVTKDREFQARVSASAVKR